MDDLIPDNIGEPSGGGGNWVLRLLIGFVLVLVVSAFLPGINAAFGNDVSKAIAYVTEHGYTVFANTDLPTGALVGTTDTQTLSNKTFTGTTVFGTINATSINMAGDIVPTTNNTRSLGSSILKFLTGWFVNINAETVNTTQLTATTGNISTLNAPTGRGATYVIAFADATATEKAQADLKLTGTGDTAAVQAYLNTANNTHIHFTSGSMNVTAHPTMNQSGQIPGLYLGNSTNVIISAEGQASRFLVTTNNTAWGIASCSNITFRNFMVVGNNNSAFSLQTGIAMFFGNDNIRIQNLDIQSTGYDGIYGLASCTNVLVEGCRITNTGDDGINPGGGFGTEAGSSNWVITNNIISGVKNDGIHISISSWGILANGNTISNCIDGVGIFNSNNHTISNNKIYNVSNGILTLSGTCAYLNIDNNYIENVSVVGINLAHASTYSKITNNKLINITDRAIFVQGGSTYVLVDGNQISTALRGVQFADVAGTVTNNHISGVSAYGVVYNVAAGTIGNALIANNNILGGGSANAIFLAGSNCSIVNNILTGYWVGGAVSPGAGTNNIIRGNWGYYTENSGNFTVSANTNTIAVTHGLALTPTDIQITFSGNTTGFVTAVGATTFNVTTTTNVTTNILGYWRAVVGAGN